MLAIIGICIAVLAIAVIEVPPLVRKRWWRELAVFSVLLLGGTGLSIAKVRHAAIPNPLDLITVIYAPVSNVVEHFLKS